MDLRGFCFDIGIGDESLPKVRFAGNGRSGWQDRRIVGWRQKNLLDGFVSAGGNLYVFGLTLKRPELVPSHRSRWLFPEARDSVPDIRAGLAVASRGRLLLIAGMPHLPEQRTFPMNRSVLNPGLEPGRETTGVGAAADCRSATKHPGHKAMKADGHARMEDMSGEVIFPVEVLSLAGQARTHEAGKLERGACSAWMIR